MRKCFLCFALLVIAIDFGVARYMDRELGQKPISEPEQSESQKYYNKIPQNSECQTFITIL